MAASNSRVMPKRFLFEYRNGRGSRTHRVRTTRLPVRRFHTKRNDAPDAIDCNLDLLEVMPRFRPAVYEESRLLEGKGTQLPGATRHAELERERRREERALFEELSRHYKLPPRRKRWRRPELLKKRKRQSPSTKPIDRSPASPVVLKDLDDYPHLVRPPKRAATQPTSITVIPHT